MKFTIHHNDSKSNARAGTIETDNGSIETPIFMPVGTQATVKAVHFSELENDIQAQIILGNTYHLYLRPGIEILENAGGLHQFNSWKRPILTDSGGYQVYSLSHRRKITEEGVTFRSHIDGSKHLFTPENVMDTQRIIGADFIGNDKVALVLGDNIFYGSGLSKLLQANNDPEGGVVYAYQVQDPERYGVVEFDKNFNVLSIEEKPKQPKSHYAVVGLYFYDNSVVAKAKALKPSARGELEITDLNRVFLNEKKLRVNVMGRGYAWLDTGTHDSLLDASHFVSLIEKRQALKVACIEEIAFIKGYIDAAQLKKLAKPLEKIDYGKYLLRLAESKPA